uniref:NAD(P)(+)--arginine ADP-ribosyltransferase n=1 Tax=Kryptolebias marmoratus TaxID=37003 RepID=A0A3Q3GZL0_KRYMA
MKTNRLTLTSLCLLLVKNGRIALSMSEQSVDDMYSTCSETMVGNVKNKYFTKETKSDLFKKVWQGAEKCANKSLSRKDKEDKALTKDHMQAICVYTGNNDQFYEKFNKAVRTEHKGYGSSFQYHSLHFWLTRAVQILCKNQNCHETYRRTKTEFVGKVNQEIRFGAFTSTSKLPSLTKFGHITCFKIKTCSGAFLKEYPRLGSHEQEVLIPPYEKFKITERCETEECKALQNLDDCKTVYVLQSAGVHSNLDCKLVKSTLI